jgi:uncharacterized RDD family membrane protein YckC
MLASRTNRLLGQFIDSLIGVAPIVAGMVALSVGVASGPPISLQFGALIYLLGILWSLYYFLLADSMHDGQSFAKQWLGMRVIDRASGAPCTMSQSFVRNLLLMLLGPLDWLFIFGERHQRLGDIVAGTIVIAV